MWQGASRAFRRNFVPHSSYARQVYLPLFFFSPYCLRQLLALKLPNIGEKQVKNRRATRGKEKADFRKHKSVGETPYSTFIPIRPKNLRAVRCNFRGVRVPFRRWLSRTGRARGVRGNPHAHVGSQNQPTSLLSQRTLKIFAPCAHLLGASKCFHKGGFPVRTGRVAYFAYASGLGAQGNALREVLSRAVKWNPLLKEYSCRGGGLLRPTSTAPSRST